MDFDIRAVRGAPGNPLRAVLPVEGTDRFDPFLVLHEQGPVYYALGEAIGFEDHPHRGFETVNYIVEGEQFHRNSHGCCESRVAIARGGSAGDEPRSTLARRARSRRTRFRSVRPNRAADRRTRRFGRPRS